MYMFVCVVVRYRIVEPIWWLARQSAQYVCMYVRESIFQPANLQCIGITSPSTYTYEHIHNAIWNLDGIAHSYFLDEWIVFAPKKPLYRWTSIYLCFTVLMNAVIRSSFYVASFRSIGDELTLHDFWSFINWIRLQFYYYFFLRSCLSISYSKCLQCTAHIVHWYE